MKNDNIGTIAGFLNSKKLLDNDKKKGDHQFTKDSSQKSLSRTFLSSNSKIKEDLQNISCSPTINNFNTRNNLRSYIKQFNNNETSRNINMEISRKDNQFDIQSPVINNIIPISISSSKIKSSKKQTTSNIKNYQNRISQQSYEYQQPPTLNPNKKGMWVDTNINNNFNSSRLQSKQCLENLSRKILKQLQTIESTIEIFSKKMEDALKQEYSKLNLSIKQSIDKIFQLYKEDIFQLAQREQQNANQQIYKTKGQLQNMYVKIQKMKQGLETQNWKKIAGELLATQLEQQIQNLLQKSEGKINLTNVTFQLDKKKTDEFQQSLSNLLKVKISRSIYKNDQKKFLRTNLNNF